MTEITPLVEHLFRHSAGQMVAALTRLLGPARLDLAEEMVQEALIKALKSWPYRGVPANPKAWLLQVARNRALDVLRREGGLPVKLRLLGMDPTSPAAALPGQDEAELVADDELAMIFMCCHPALSPLTRTTLTLKTVCGFSVDEIAAALLAQPSAVAQRIVRAKRQIETEAIPFAIPSSAELTARRENVLAVLYLLFNEGYSAHTGEDLVRADLCAEAIRLGSMLADNPATGGPPVDALLALMHLQASRLPARVDGDGALLLMDEQDRSRWDRGL
ncbi:MAG: polymerase subunit sigma-70, partial [Firmicutes bacterium]|nr:polymerase subunit sigma-70 [Bacillota bacterium]